ncbi:MAG: magnetochrome domain-containing protein [Magnetococcus sp. DMHC-1]|nr:magnetochrome domain-containing protein [Magnetococcales bacterium]
MRNRRPNRVKPFTSMLMVLVILGTGGLLYEKYQGTLAEWTQTRLPRFVRGEIFGTMPAPTEPTMPEQVIDTMNAIQKNPVRPTKMVVKRLPIIPRNARIPHPYWGNCTKCHLIQGGAPPGSQPITPVGKVLERVSSIYKIGPPILPDSTRHHPAAGRCIKCHDIVVQVPAG